MSKAMVVDDSRAVRMILGRLLARLGYDVHAAGNGREALEVLARETCGIELALVDWNMPEMTGIEFIRAARANPEWRRMAIIMVTTETETSQVVAALAAGANEYVMKPFTEDMIVEKIRMVCPPVGEGARPAC